MEKGIKTTDLLKVAIVGAESTGKTSLAEALAVYYSTNMVNWQLLTNAYLMTNPFLSPNSWPGVATTVMVLDPITGSGR